MILHGSDQKLFSLITTSKLKIHRNALMARAPLQTPREKHILQHFPFSLDFGKKDKKCENTEQKGKRKKRKRRAENEEKRKKMGGGEKSMVDITHFDFKTLAAM